MIWRPLAPAAAVAVALTAAVALVLTSRVGRHQQVTGNPHQCSDPTGWAIVTPLPVHTSTGRQARGALLPISGGALYYHLVPGRSLAAYGEVIALCER